MIESVAGMISAPPMPITARTAISWFALCDDEHAEAAAAEQGETDLQGVLAAEAVAERAHRQEQAGEDEHVGVDDPLERRRRGVEVLLQARQGDVQDGVVEPDDHAG